MVRVRIGSSWRQDPRVRAALARGGPAADRAAAQAVDAVGLEVDGVDVAAGRAEGALVASVSDLGEALLRLLAGHPRAHVHFSDGGLELVLSRRGASALATVVSLARPARVLARDVEVELAELAEAVAEAAGGLAEQLAGLRPDAGEPSPARALRELAARLAAASPAPPAEPSSPSLGPAAAPSRRAGAPTCAFELRDDAGLIASYRGPGADLGSLLVPGRVVLRAADGRELVALPGPPFLVLRDLADFAGRLVDAVRRGEEAVEVELAGPGREAVIRLAADLREGTVAREGGRPLPGPPLLLARALLEAALDLCGAVAARNAAQADNPWLSELRVGAGERLAHLLELAAGDAPAREPTPLRAPRASRLPRAPLGPGRVRRTVFRRAFEADVGPPAGFGLARVKDLLVAAGEAAVLGLDPASGAERWRRPGASLAAASPGALILVGGGALAAVDPATGRERWARAVAGLPSVPQGIVRLHAGLALALAPGAAAALDPSTGEQAWTFAPPAAHALRAVAAGSLAVIATDAGFLYGLDAGTGRLAWRLRLPGPPASAPLRWGELCCVACATPLGGSLVALDAATGRRRFEAPLDAAPTGAPVPFAGLLAVPGLVAGDPVVAAVDPSGRLVWEDAPPLGAGPVTAAALPSGLLAAAGHGACVALDRAGGTRWSRAPADEHPTAAHAAPVVARGVALVAGEQVEALAVDDGEKLGEVPIAAPFRLLADAALRIWGIDAAGVVTAVRLETHLSLVPSAGRGGPGGGRTS